MGESCIFEAHVSFDVVEPVIDGAESVSLHDDGVDEGEFERICEVCEGCI